MISVPRNETNPTFSVYYLCNKNSIMAKKPDLSHHVMGDPVLQMAPAWARVVAMPLSHTGFPAWCPPHGNCKQELDIDSDHKMPLQSSSQGGGSGCQVTTGSMSARAWVDKSTVGLQAVAFSSVPECVILTPCRSSPGLADFS